MRSAIEEMSCAEALGLRLGETRLLLAAGDGGDRIGGHLADGIHAGRERRQAGADVVGRLGAVAGELLHLVGDDGKAAAGRAGAGGLDGGVQGKKVRLAGNRLDGAGHLGDLAHGRVELAAALGDRSDLSGDLAHGLAGLAHLGNVFLDAVAHARGVGGAGLARLGDLADRFGELGDGAADRGRVVGDLLDVVGDPADVGAGSGHFRRELSEARGRGRFFLARGRGRARGRRGGPRGRDGRVCSRRRAPAPRWPRRSRGRRVPSLLRQMPERPANGLRAPTS